MTVSTTNTKVSFTGSSSNGTDGTSTFAYNFKVFSDSEIKVIIRTTATGVETTKTLTTHYTVTGAGEDAGGNVVFTSGNNPLSSETVIIKRNIGLAQGTDYVANDPFPAESHEDGLDKLVHMVIQQQEEIDRCLKASETLTDLTTPEFTDAAASRADKVLGFSSDGTTLTTTTTFNPAGGDTSQFTYSTTTTDSDPGSGIVRFNHATLASATIAYVDDLDALGTDVSAWVQSFDDVTGNATNRGRIRIHKAGNLAIWATYKVSGAITDASGYSKIPITYIDGAGSFTNTDTIFLSFTASGEDGAIPGYYLKFDTSTSDADPGAGEIAFNNGTYASVTEIYIDDADANGVTIAGDTDTWDDSTSSIKGQIMIYDINDSTTYARFKITGSTTDASGYSKLAVAHLASNNTFSAADELSVHFTQSGYKGDTGSTGSTGPTGSAGTNSQLSMTWESTTTDADPGAGKIAFNNATISSVTRLYVDDADDSGANIQPYVITWDDVSNSTARGYVTITKEGTPSTYALFKVSGASTDESGYTTIVVTHISSNGSFSDDDGVGVHFATSGADGSTGPSGPSTSFTLAAASGPSQTISDTNTMTIAAGEGIDTTASATDTVTISGEDASTSNKGVASFLAQEFTVTSGAVSFNDSMHPTITGTGKALVLGF